MSSAVFKFLPARWQSGLAKGVAEALARPFDLWRAQIRSLPAYLTPDGAPESWLDWLLSLQGYPYTPGLSVASKRALLEGGVERWSRKGLATAIVEWTRALAGITATVLDPAAYAFVAGVGRPGDICGPGETAWLFTIQVPAGAIAEADLRALLEPVVPAFVVYTVEEV